MSYRFEQTKNGTDIVIDGWEVGISNSPYQTIVPTTMVSNGVSDMRNIDIITVPGEASVALATTAMTSNIALSNVAYTVNTATDTFTWAGGTTLPNGTAIQFTNSGGALPSPLSSATAYYITNTTATTFQVSLPSALVQVLAIGGGGGGGGGQAFGGTHLAGGGGAGGYQYQATHAIRPFAYPIVVGTGGAGGAIGGGDGANGVDTTFDNITALGGGAGAGVNRTGFDGGSGGGGEWYGGIALGGIGSQGHNGGAGSGSSGGGGGGSSTAGTDGSAGGGGTGGPGGSGTSNSITGAPVTYAGGGGGAGVGVAGTGGSGGGGIAGLGTNNGTVGTANTGSGGGAGGLPTGASTGTTGGNGGAGVVIISYPTGTITATGGVITTSGGNTIHTFTTSGTWTVSSVNTVIDITTTGSGTNTFSVINMAQPNYIQGVNVQQSSLYFALDSNGRAWVYDNQYLSNSGKWIYMSNLLDETVIDSGLGLQPWKGYLFTFGVSSVNYISLTSSAGVAGNLQWFTNRNNWVRSWKTAAPTSLSHYTLVGQDDVLYFCNVNSIGSILEKAGQTFDPTSAATYTYNNTALNLPSEEQSTCLAELGVNLMVGGVRNYIYPWDRTSVSFAYPIFLAENYTYRMVTVNTTTYMFTGQRGRIFLTNGSNAQLFTKMPDHLSNTTNPYYQWGDAVFNKNQLYFGVTATTNANVAIPQYGGLWAIDLDTRAMRLTNQLSYGSYAGNATALCSLIVTPFTVPLLPTSDGYGLYIGWYTTIGGIDKGSSSPYTGGQAYVDTDIIPVGTFLTKKTYSQIEFKLSTPLVAGESVSLNYRTNITEAYTNVSITAGNDVGDLSGYGVVDFQNVQWIQIRPYLTSTATNPSFVRLKELRIR